MDPLSDFNWIHSKEKKKRAVLLGFTWGGLFRRKGQVQLLLGSEQNNKQQKEK